MAEVFEDKLMNLQERIVSTCLEALEGLIRPIYMGIGPIRQFSLMCFSRLGILLWDMGSLE